jgi:hypothetical protein
MQNHTHIMLLYEHEKLIIKYFLKMKMKDKIEKF